MSPHDRAKTKKQKVHRKVQVLAEDWNARVIKQYMPATATHTIFLRFLNKEAPVSTYTEFAQAKLAGKFELYDCFVFRVHSLIMSVTI